MFKFHLAHTPIGLAVKLHQALVKGSQATPSSLAGKRIVYFLLSLLPPFPPVQVQINSNQASHVKKLAKSRPKPAKNFPPAFFWPQSTSHAPSLKP